MSDEERTERVLTHLDRDKEERAEWVRMVEALQAERDSLRAALEHMQKIARAIGTGPAEAVWDGCKTLDDIARQALTSSEKEKA